ncbi:hypothetical protein [Cohnella hongkongensis]|uniref:Uncharacterized protein n=1 Tax=Cohnella hongkongensis TaxID=178337 RepID=A0ABV9FED3_9BACL
MNRIGSNLRFVKVTGELRKDKCEFKIAPWRLLLETQRYYEIRPEHGAVKRIYKEKLNTTTLETKQYANGTLCCSAFCTEDRVEEIQQVILHQLEASVKTYMNDLRMNLLALNRYLSSR